MTRVATGFLDDDDDYKRDKPIPDLNGKAPAGREKHPPKPKHESFDELITSCQFAQLLKVSLRTLWRLVSTGKAPRPLKLHGSTRWQKSVVMKWIQDGCPPQ